MMQTGAVHPVERVGVLTPKGLEVDALGPGDVGFLNAGIKTVADTQVGDTITDERRPAASALAGFKPSVRSEEHTSELQSLMRISDAVFCLKKTKNTTTQS